MKEDTIYRLRRRKGLPLHGRTKTSIRIHLENCIYAFLIVKTHGMEQEFIPIRRIDIQHGFRDVHGINLTERQVSYLLDTLAKRGIIEREFHSRDRSARSWKDQVTRYKVVNRSWSSR